jgi:hypothetical protein
MFRIPYVIYLGIQFYIRPFTVIVCIQAYLDRGYFWALFQLPPAII